MTPRIITCTETQVQFPYSGRGRPPLYHPDVAARKIMERQRASSKRAQAKKKAARDLAKEDIKKTPKSAPKSAPKQAAQN